MTKTEQKDNECPYCKSNGSLTKTGYYVRGFACQTLIYENSSKPPQISNQCFKNQIKILQEEIVEKDKDIEWLRKRDGNATIELCYNDGVNPFARETLKCVDIGVSDNIYIVESETVKSLQASIKALEEANSAANSPYNKRYYG